MPNTPFKALDMAAAEVEIEAIDGGSILRSPQTLDPYPRCVGEMLCHWATAAPDRTFMAERGADDAWRRVTYGETLAAVRNLGQALLDRRLDDDRPVAILSDNGIDNGLLQLAAMHVGIPVAPVSPAYSLMSTDFGKLATIAETLTPGLVFAADGAAFADAFSAVDFGDAEIIAGDDGTFAGLMATTPTDAVEAAFQAVGPDSIAKLLFTSGSTGQPKGVINTQRMLCSNQQAIRQLWPFLEARPPVIVDWLPWNHTFGANYNFNLILWHGGTLYIDGGKPVPGLIDRTVANLTEIQSTIHFNVPRGFDMLVSHLETDASLRGTFFADLDLIFYAGAALPQNLWRRLEAVSIEARGERVMMISGWGSTETAPMATTVHFPIERAGIIGLPAPGTDIKMVDNDGKSELRVRGPNVTPGYWRRPDLTDAAFDDDGFYRIGDAGKLVDADDPALGLVFDGRIAEDFKLMSGTWVHVGVLRVKAIAALTPLAQDVVVAGDGREDVGLLVFPNLAGCRSLCPDAGDDATLDDLIGHGAVRDAVSHGLDAYNAVNPGNSTRVDRVLLMAEPPLIDANEITDKGYLNQRAVLARRADQVERLYGDDEAVIVLA
jgi:feruloyl-CoA synthase